MRSQPKNDFSNQGASPVAVISLSRQDGKADAVVAMSLPAMGKDFGASEPGDRIFSVMNWGCAFDHSTASRFDSKNRSITMAFFWAAVRPQAREDFRLTTAGPVSTAVQTTSGKTTLLP